MLELLSLALLLVAAVFFSAGTLGLLRLPDTLCRIHALTKADTLGLGLVALALMVQAESWAAVGQILLIWLLAVMASATSASLLAGHCLEPASGDGTEPTVSKASRHESRGP